MKPDTKAIRLRTRAGVPALRDEVDALCDRVEALSAALRDICDAHDAATNLTLSVRLHNALRAGGKTLEGGEP